MQQRRKTKTTVTGDVLQSQNDAILVLVDLVVGTDPQPHVGCFAQRSWLLFPLDQVNDLMSSSCLVGMLLFLACLSLSGMALLGSLMWSRLIPSRRLIVEVCCFGGLLGSDPFSASILLCLGALWSLLVVLG